MQAVSWFSSGFYSYLSLWFATFILERKLRGDLRNVYKYLKHCKENGSFPCVQSQWTWSETQEVPSRYWAMLFHCESDSTGRGCLGGVMKSPSLEIIQSHPDTISGCRWPCLSRGLDQVTSRGLFQHQSFRDSVKIKSSGSPLVLTSVQTFYLRWYFQTQNIPTLIGIDIFSVVLSQNFMRTFWSNGNYQFSRL